MTGLRLDAELESATRVERSKVRARADGRIDRTTASFGLWPWVRLAESKGDSIEQFCELAGIAESAVRELGVRFSQPVSNRVAQLAYTRFGPSAAMEAGLLVKAGQFALLELIVRSTPSVSKGLEYGCLFFPLLHDGGHLCYDPLADGGAALRWEPPQSYAVHHGYVELTFAVTLLGIRRETGCPDALPEEIWFRHDAPDDLSFHRRVLGVEPRFGMPEDHVIFGASMAALRPMRADDALHRAAADAGAAVLEE
jgi:AraC-type transcriptional regulator